MRADGVLLALFFVSGFLSLVYQIVWSRLFYPVFGMNLPAITAVVAAFMGGLGAGAHLLGRRADRLPPWRTYALLEAGIGCFGLLVPHLAAPCGALFARVTPLGTPDFVVHLVRFAGVTLLLAGPCVLMGGTFPVFVRGYAHASARLGKDVGALYAINTVGAAAGCFLAGVWLLPSFGLKEISYAAAAGNFALALAMGLWNPERRKSAEPVVAAARAVETPAWALLTLLFLTGYLGLSFELLWTRALTQPLGATYFSFSMILTAMLVGIFLGSAVYRALLADRDRPGLLPGLTVLLFCASAASFLIVARLQSLLQALRAALPFEPTGLAFALLPTLILCLVAFLPTATVLGAIFPCCLRRYAAHGDRLGRDLGLAYGVNTAGAVAGVVLTGLVTIEHLGSGGTLRLLLLITAGAVGVAFLSVGRRPFRLVLAGVVPVALAIALLFPRDVFFANQLAALWAQLPADSQVLFRGEDATSMATLVEMPGQPFRYVEDAGLREGKQRNIFHSNWRGVGGTRIYLWNVAGGYLAGLLHPDPEDILVIGYGSGRQLKTLVGLTHPRRIDVVEVNPLNFAASDYFYLSSADVLADPRVHVYVDDGRNHLLRSRQRYDVILVDVGGIEVDGGEFFYTREFLQLCRLHLKPKGLVFTWMDIRRMLEPVGMEYQNTLRGVFPESSAWLGTGEQTSYGWLWLIGSDGPLTIDAATLRRRWDSLTPTQRAELELAGMREPAQMASLYLTDLRELSSPAVPRAAFTDDQPYCKPIVEAPAGDADALDSSIRRLLESGEDPPLVGATDEELRGVQEHRALLQRMARKGTSMGPFRLRAQPGP